MTDRKNRKAAALSLIAAACILLGSAVPAFAAEENEGPQAKNGITTIEQLDDRTIGVQTGVLYEDEIKDEIEGEEWLYYKMPNDMIEALKANKIDAYLIEEVGFYAQRYEHPELMRMEEKAGQSEFAVIVGNNDRQDLLFQQIQEFIDEKEADGWLPQLYDYWVVNWDPNSCVIEDIPVTTGENGTVSIAIEGGYEPFSFESNGGFSGYDVEFMMNFCAAYGYDWDFRAMEFDAIAPGCISGKYDFGMNIVVDEERAEVSVLSDPYYTCDLVFVVEAEYEDDMGFLERLEYRFFKTFIKDSRWRLFAEGVGNTMLITLTSVILGTVLGFAAYMACRHGNRLANGIMDVFDWFFEGIPIVVFLMLLAFVVFRDTKNMNLVAIIGFTLIFGCGMYDMLRVGCDAVPQGQTEASLALGYSDTQSFFHIILPQASKHFMPIYKNDVISLLKETSVVGYIAAMDLTKMGDIVRSRTYEAFFTLIAVAAIYFLLEGVLLAIMNRIERNINTKGRPRENILRGIVEEL